MIIRIVKMTFDPLRVNDFLQVFNASKKSIRNFEGCSHLELLKNVNEENVYFTYSYWENEQALENYRNSDLFKSTWARTKVLFIQRPEAYSLMLKEAISK